MEVRRAQKLARPGYYTMPPLNGASLVQGFTLGRRGYGSIYFPGPMDVSNLNLDEMVDFGLGTITVNSEKLNRRAQVTLEQVWPRCHKTGRVLKAVEDLAEVGFVERLCLLSSRQKTTFVDYQPESGSWVFMVDHFSTYSYNDDDVFDDSEKELEKQEGGAKAKEQEMKGLGGLQLTGPDDTTLLVTDASQPASPQAETSPVFLRNQKNSMVMKSTFFSDASGGVIVMDTPTPAARQQEPRWPNRSIKTISPKYFPILNPTHLAPPRRSLLTYRNYNSMSLFKGRSFKVGWTRGFAYVTITQPSTIQHLKLEALSGQQTMNLEAHLEVVFEESAHQSSGAPTFTANQGVIGLMRHQRLALSSNAFYYQQVWNLCVALWGPQATTPTERRQSFSKFLEDVAVPRLQSELDLTTLRTSALIRNVFVYLTGHKVDEAARLALEEGLPRLACLIAQTTANDVARALMASQIHQWATSGILELIGEDALKIYMLLGGVSLLPGVNVCEGLDWKRALGVHLWYMSPPGTSLIPAIQEYQVAFSEVGYAAPPNPDRHEMGDTRDVLYQIMSLFKAPTTCLETVVDPTTHTSDALDYRLTWLLLQTFQSLQLGCVSPKTTDAACVSFAAQLEHLDLWKWSIFVLLFLKDPSVRTNTIVEILGRNLRGHSDTDGLVNDFQVPPDWIHRVLAEKSTHPIEIYTNLILIKDWQGAHDVAVGDLIPDLISARCNRVLLGLLSELVPGRRAILEWDQRGGLVLDFLRVQQRLGEGEREGLSEVDLKQLKCKVMGICVRVKEFPMESPKQAVAVAEMSRFISGLLKVLYCELQPPSRSNVAAALELMTLLVMPTDYKQEELMKYMQKYLVT